MAWITGASSGIGRQLALDLAGQGYTVAATARRQDKLNELVAEATQSAGKILPCPGDVTDRTAMGQLVDHIETDIGPVVLAVFNAGNYFPASGDRLNSADFVRTYDINLFGVINGLVPVVDRMKTRGQGQIAFVSSVSGYGGWPMTSAYGASKAALINMAEALKFDFDKMNIRIQLINPGFIDTPLTEPNRFRMPALMSADQASRRITTGLRNGGFEITFPRRFTWWLKLISHVPYPAYFWVMNRMTGWNKRPIRKS